jgi:two-component system, NarL family, invasion response regulator UvrY
VQNYHYQIKSKIGARTDAHLVWLATAAGLVTLESVGREPRGFGPENSPGS